MEPFVYKQGWNDERKLLMKLAEMMKEARYIQKRGENKFHRYNYVTEADVNEKVGEMLAARNIMFVPSMLSNELRETVTQKGNTEYIIKVNMQFSFIDAETGESIVMLMSGEGQDNGDKAIYKAISGCQKYCLLKMFMLASGDDPEADEGVDKRNAEREMKTGNDFKHQKEPESLLPSLKAKWQVLSPNKDLEGFDEWYNGQIAKGIDEKSLNVMLTKKVNENNTKGN